MAFVSKGLRFGIATRGLARSTFQRQFSTSLSSFTQNKKLLSWIEEKRAFLTPDEVVMVTGTEEEKKQMNKMLVDAGCMEELNPEKRPGSFLARSDPADVARAEDATFICSEKEKDAGVTNNWMEPTIMRDWISTNFAGAMKGRKMYVIPYSMGPVGSPLSRIGIQVTDSAFVVANMKIMARVGENVLKALGDDDFVPCTHTVGVPLSPGDKDVAWPCNIPKRRIIHFPETREIFSIGSGYGGNAILGKKCFALRIASAMAHQEGWMAEHMLILGITNPAGKKHYIAAAFPSACGKTNMAMMQPSLPGWKIECVGDDISWMRVGEDGQLYAINPEAGFFGVAPGTSDKTNPHAMASCAKNSIFTNVAKTEDGDVWWEGMGPAPDTVTDWYGVKRDPKVGAPVAHPNSRFTAPAAQCPIISEHWEDVQGVPISAFLFGGRRPSTIPLVYESRDWEHGTFMGASVSSQKTAAQEGATGDLRFDPMAMLPFCGYNMGDYFQHWLNMGKKSDKMPKIFNVNWFRTDADGKFMWPGFGDNVRVLQWITDRIEGVDNAVDSPIGKIPKTGSVDVSGLNVSDETMAALTQVNVDEFLEEAQKIRAYHSKFGDSLPEGISNQLNNLEARLKDAKAQQ